MAQVNIHTHPDGLVRKVYKPSAETSTANSEIDNKNRADSIVGPAVKTRGPRR
jgi:hypothetical protein